MKLKLTMTTEGLHGPNTRITIVRTGDVGEALEAAARRWFGRNASIYTSAAHEPELPLTTLATAVREPGDGDAYKLATFDLAIEEVAK